MLPLKILKNIIKYPESRETKEAKALIEDLYNMGYSQNDIKEMTISRKDALNKLESLNIKKDTTLYEFYTNGLNEAGFLTPEEADDLYGLDEIYENYQIPHPLYAQYPQIGKRYLQISSAEGEHSYFYDKETDAVYSVDWSQLDDLNAGKLKPMFSSFYDFLEWYYSEEADE